MRTLLLSLAAMFLAVDGYVHGLWTNRWDVSHELEEAAARLNAVPMDFGDWHGEARALQPREVEVAGFTGYLRRGYVQRQDGRVVDVLLSCGPPGPLSVHTPEACFGGAGYALTQAPAIEVLPCPGLFRNAEFWKAKYEKPQAIPPVRMRVLWSWHAEGAWQVPANPRMSFAGLPALYKLYVTCSLNGFQEARDDALCAKFLKVFLPELDKSLFAAPK